MKNIKKIGLYLILITLVLLSVVGCTAEKQGEEILLVEDGQVEDGQQDEIASNYPIDIVDNFGQRARIEEEPMKIISLAPHNTEILFALGLEEKIVGVTSYCDYPEEVTNKEVIGSFNEFNLERIIELEPDLVLVYGSGDEDENKILKEAGINILGFMPETINEVIEDMKKIGEVTNSSEKAIELTDLMIAKKNKIIEKVKEEEPVRVFYEIWHDPLQAAGKGSFMGELLTLAGGENIAIDEKAEEGGVAYPIFDLEQIIERDPEVYLTSAHIPEKTIESIKERPGYEDITAIKNSRIYIFEGNESNIVSRPGPRIVEALELVAKSIHPELFE